jgi:hypothetical protein
MPFFETTDGSRLNFIFMGHLRRLISDADASDKPYELIMAQIDAVDRYFDDPKNRRADAGQMLLSGLRTFYWKVVGQIGEEDRLDASAVVTAGEKACRQIRCEIDAIQIPAATREIVSSTHLKMTGG